MNSTIEAIRQRNAKAQAGDPSVYTGHGRGDVPILLAEIDRQAAELQQLRESLERRGIWPGPFH